MEKISNGLQPLKRGQSEQKFSRYNKKAELLREEQEKETLLDRKSPIRVTKMLKSLRTSKPLQMQFKVIS